MVDRPSQGMRKAFSTSRLAEFATVQGLSTRVGLHPSLWPYVVIKELLDNALDDAETTSIVPHALVAVADDTITVEDRGSGVDPDTLVRIFDYDRQTSSREAYVEPTRGAQGNALQTILAMPYVLSDGKRGELVIEARGVRHDIAFTADPVTAKPVVVHQRSDSDVTTGTRIMVKWPRPLDESTRIKLRQFAMKFTDFNPDLTLVVEGAEYEATNYQWTKRRPDRPPVARWYNLMTLKRLMQAYAHDAETRGLPVLTVGALVREFAGLSATQKAAEIVNSLGLARLTLADLLRSANCDDAITALLAAMKAATRPVKAVELGVLGRDHIVEIAHGYRVAEDAKVEYLKEAFEADGLPFFAEVECKQPRAHRRIQLLAGLFR
jgi:DNA topoisomerase VI subunit B